MRILPQIDQDCKFCLFSCVGWSGSLQVSSRLTVVPAYFTPLKAGRKSASRVDSVLRSCGCLPGGHTGRRKADFDGAEGWPSELNFSTFDSRLNGILTDWLLRRSPLQEFISGAVSPGLLPSSETGPFSPISNCPEIVHLSTSIYVTLVERCMAATL